MRNCLACRVHCYFNVVMSLQIHPKLMAGVEVACKAKRGVCRNAAPLAGDVISRPG